MKCNIFNKPLTLDIVNYNNINVNTSWLNSLIPAYNSELSGVWRPIIISMSQSQTNYVEPLYPARNKASTAFSPCNCQDSQINSDPLYQEESIIGLCDYCNNSNAEENAPTKWRLWDDEGNASPREHDTSCCGGGCDVMFKVDDYIPKIPYLNHSYITGIVDSKHHKQFPACNNKALGKEGFIVVTDNNLRSIKGASLRLDWKIQETISEKPYDPFVSQHDSQYLHETSFHRSNLTSSTCGNFIMLSLPEQADTGCFYLTQYPKLQNLIFSRISGDSPNTNIPTIESFNQIPYGFDRETYNNIFINNEKIGSYWKWNYQSGVLCWYRYYDRDRIDDQRPIPGIDLYISKGDVFFAQNDGPEPQTDLKDPLTRVGSVQSCPSGLKIVKGSEVQCIIPSGSNFAYISANIYSKFYNLYQTLLQTLPTGGSVPLPERAFSTAAILATAPEYDKITLDLLKRNNNTLLYSVNEFGQLRTLNRDMQKGNEFDSVSRLNYIHDKKELLDTLTIKYGVYLWLPPNTNSSITFPASVGNNPFAVSLDFGLTMLQSDTLWASTSCSKLKNCGERTLRKNFSYEQDIGYAADSVYTATNENIRYNTICEGGNLSPANFGLYSNVYFNNSLIKSVFTSDGCSTISGVYPRISESTNANFCSNCDEYSSFYLIEDAESEECGKFNEDASFCYATLARRFNGSPPQFSGDTQKRPERNLADGAKRWVRSYKALLFNPYISNVAFHQDHGVFINSVPYQLNNFTAFEKNTTNRNAGAADEIYVDFTTKDLGIKLYSISAEYIQTSSAGTYGCKRFPVKDSCQCLPMISIDVADRPVDCDNPNINRITSSNIWTPGLSTRYSPRLKQYGGFSQEYLDSIFGENIITAGGVVPVLRTFIDPRAPQGCDSSASIVLNNYTNTTWNISLIGLQPQTELSVQVTEGVDLLTERYNAVLILEGGTDSNGVGIITGSRIEYRPIIPSKRYATKVTINDLDILYDGQEKLLTDKPSNIKVELQNPFLEAAIVEHGGEPKTVLFPPSGRLLDAYIFNDNGFTPIGDVKRGNEISSITLTFTQKFKKHKLLYKIPALQPMGTLTQGIFEPNHGLKPSTDNETAFSKTDGLLYRKELTNETLPAGKVYYGKINNRILNVIRSLDEFDYHKKLRLYIRTGGKWYQYVGSNLGSFNINGVKYPGTPTYFEYNTKENSKNLQSFFISPVKKHIPLQFVNNVNYLDDTAVPLYGKPELFPLLQNACRAFRPNGIRTTTIMVPGIRHYFLVPELDPARAIPADNLDDALESSPSLFDGLKYGQSIVFTNGDHWICINPSNATDRSSYVFSEFNYLYHNFSDTHLDFQGINKQGYVYNTQRLCNYSVKLFSRPYSLLNPALSAFSQNNLTVSTNTIISKSIYVSYKGKDGQAVKNFLTEDVYMQPFTVFTLQFPAPSTVSMIDVYPPDYSNAPSELSPLLSAGCSLVVSQNTVVMAEADALLMNKYSPGKWGDVINYNNELVDSIIDAQFNIKDIYPESAYNNLFQQILINNHSNKHIYTIDSTMRTDSDRQLARVGDEISNEVSQILVSGNRGINETKKGDVYYSILHKYAIGDETQAYSIQTQQYQNFVPLIDINMLGFEGGLSPVGNIDIPQTGTIKISNITYSTTPNTGQGYLPYEDNLFWISIPSEDKLEGTFVPVSDFYNDTLRLDDPVYWMSYARTRSSRIADDRFRQVFSLKNRPSYSLSYVGLENGSSYRINWVDRDTPYWTYPIYGDRDDNTCNNSGCFGREDHGISKAGEYSLTAVYRVAEPLSANLSSSSFEFALGYDAGIYNIIGNDSLISIDRFELDSDNIIDNLTNQCSSRTVLPDNYKLNPSAPLYQNTITNSNISRQLFYDVDEVANEMLFRILYGQAEFVNRKMYYVDNPIYSKNDIVRYNDPEITTEDIYSQILYNYDRGARANNFSINGSMAIYGVTSVGTTTTINIQGLILTIRILNLNGDIYAECTTNTGASIKNLIYQEIYTRSEYITQVWGEDEPRPDPPEPANENTTISFVGECEYYNSYRYWPIVSAFQSDQGTPDFSPLQPVELSVSCGISWVGAYGDGSKGRAGVCCCGPAGPCGVLCSTRSIRRLLIANHRQCVCGVEQVGAVQFMAPLTRDPVYPCEGNAYTYYAGREGDCTPFTYGFCRKQNCDKCEETIIREDARNFTYTFEHCRTELSLYGHAYREIHKAPPDIEIIQPRPPECYTNHNYNYITDECNECPPGQECTEDLGEVTNCDYWPRIGPGRASTEELAMRAGIVGFSAGSTVCYTCNSTRTEYIPPSPNPAEPVCFPVIGALSRCGDGARDCWWGSCGRNTPCFPGGFDDGVSPNVGCDPGYTEEVPRPPPCSYCVAGTVFQNCAETVNSPAVGPGATDGCENYCNACGVGRDGNRNRLSSTIYYLQKTNTIQPPYSPQCAVLLCNISYNSASVTIDLLGKSLCITRSINTCPNIDINSTMEQLNVVDTIDSSCDECAATALKISMVEQSMPFVTKTEPRRCLLGTVTVCSHNPQGIAAGSVQFYTWGESWAMQCGGGTPFYGCKRLGSVMYDNSDGDLTYPITYECLEGLNCQIQANVAPYEIPEIAWRYSQIYKSRFAFLGKNADHIPVSDIIEGVVPGSVSDVQQTSYNDGGVAISRDGTIINDVMTVYAFYYTYSYIRPVTMQDILRNDDSILCTDDYLQVLDNNTYASCTFLPFPSIYASKVGWPFSRNWDVYEGNLDGVSYVHVKPYYYQRSGCESSISCYYKHEVFICGTNDICCLAQNRVIDNTGEKEMCSLEEVPFVAPEGPIIRWQPVFLGRIF